MKIINTTAYSVPMPETVDGDPASSLVIVDILTASDDKKFCVYRVLVPYEEYHYALEARIERWALMGMKLPCRIAIGSYPNLTEDNYRH